jgi:hypothetical protein
MSSDRFELLKAPARVAPACSAAVPALGTINPVGVPKYGPQPIEIRSGAFGAQPVADGVGHCAVAVGELLAGHVVRYGDLRGAGPSATEIGPGHDVRVVVRGS